MGPKEIKRVITYFTHFFEAFNYRNAFVFIVCLALSSFLWLLSSLEKRYTSRITIPVTYVDYPKLKQLSSPLPGKFDLIVDANGYTLLIHKLRLYFSPVVLSVNDLIDNALLDQNIFSYSISTASHKDEIEKQISNEIRIISLKPDSLNFNFSQVVSKSVKIRPRLHLNFNNQYTLQDRPTTIPDSIMLKGPKNILDTLRYVYTNEYTYNQLSNSIREKAILQQIPGIVISRKTVELFINVEQCTEISFEVPIEVLNKPGNISLKTFPAKVKVLGRIGLSKYKKIDISNFRATINFKKISTSEKSIPVLFESLSPNVLSFQYSPHEVEFVLENI